MMQNKIACTLMRSGTSRGPFIDLRDLPENTEERDAALLRIMGSPDSKQIDGIGGATFVTSKAVLVQPSEREGIDVDYLFAQVIIDQPIVDTTPTCGNMMAGVAPFAIEKGWVKATHPETKVMVYNFNTNSTIEMLVKTPNAEVNYTEGDLKVYGVPGVGAPILMNLFDIAGGATGQLFPTGNPKDIIDGIAVSIVDAGNLMMHVDAATFDMDGTEDQAYFDARPELKKKLENIRRQAGRLAGLGDVSDKVLPKIGILSKARVGGAIKSQYLTPHSLHPSHAVSGAVCIAVAAKAEGTIAAALANTSNAKAEKIVIEHPSGVLPVQLEVSGEGDTFTVEKAGTLRTARKLMEGFTFY